MGACLCVLGMVKPCLYSSTRQCTRVYYVLCICCFRHVGGSLLCFGCVPGRRSPIYRRSRLCDLPLFGQQVYTPAGADPGFWSGGQQSSDPSNKAFFPLFFLHVSVHFPFKRGSDTSNKCGKFWYGHSHETLSKIFFPRLCFKDITLENCRYSICECHFEWIQKKNAKEEDNSPAILTDMPSMFGKTIFRETKKTIFRETKIKPFSERLKRSFSEQVLV